MTLGTTLRNLRQARGITQNDLAIATKINQSAIAMYEADKRNPKYQTLEILADYFNVNINILLGKESNDLRLNSHEETLVRKYRLLDEDYQTDIDEQVEYKLYLQRKRYEDK